MIGRPEIVGIEVVSQLWDGWVYHRGERIFVNVVFSKRVEGVFWYNLKGLQSPQDSL